MLLKSHLFGIDLSNVMISQSVEIARQGLRILVQKV